MTRFFVLLFVLVISKNQIYAQKFFFDKYPEAIDRVKRCYDSLSILNALPNNEGVLIYTLAAPEVAMYYRFLDQMETKVAEVFYSNLGGEYGNFSLGIFQMKPSFAEKVEKFYTDGEFDFRYTDTNIRLIRAARVNRLKEISWQQKYLIATYKILEKKYAKQFYFKDEKIKFYAAAYNYGINAPESEIKKWQYKISFPGRGEPKLISYADLSLYFAKQMLPQDYLTEQAAPITQNEEIVKTDSITYPKDEKKSHTVNNIEKKSKEKKTEPMNYIWVILPLTLLGAVTLFIVFKTKKR